MVNEKVIMAIIRRPTDTYFSSLSCESLNQPMRYMPNKPKTTIQITRKISRVTMCACTTRSALDKNFMASASSKKPSTTFTELSQPPDFGRELSQPGKAANNPNGSARASEKPNMPKNGPASAPVEAACTNS